MLSIDELTYIFYSGISNRSFVDTQLLVDIRMLLEESYLSVEKKVKMLKHTVGR